MAKACNWFVESKEFEMLIKGGNYGLRMVERSKRRQGSVFIHRDEIAWLVGAVEVAVDVETSEVYWDQSSAGYLRLLVQRRANRHGRFIFIEELEAGKRRGSVLIPEGRHGQGWDRLTAELRNARSSLWKGRDFRERKGTQEVSGRSYAEVLGQSKPAVKESMVATAATMVGSAPTKSGRVQSHQLKPATKSKVFEEAGGGTGGAPAKTHAQASEKDAVGKVKSMICVLPEALENPVKPGEAALKEGFGFVTVHEGVDFQGLKNCLTDIRGQLELGLKRVEEVFRMLDQKEPRGAEANDVVLGSGERNRRATQLTGREEAGWSKPKRKNFRRRNNKTQPGLLGPKPSKVPIQKSKGPGHTTSSCYRIHDRRPVQQACPAGESSEMGAACSNGVNGTIFAGEFPGEHLAGIGAPYTVVSGATREADKDGELFDGAGLREQARTKRLVTIPEGDDGLGSNLSLLSSIPESEEAPGCSALPPEKSSKCLFVSSEYSGEEAFDSYTPGKQPKQVKIFQRRERSSSKTTKSWVAERVAWNGGRGCDVTTEIGSGKNHNICLDLEEQTIDVGAELGEHGMGNQEKQFSGDEGNFSQLAMEDSPGKYPVQGIDLDLVWAVKGNTGMTWEGQDGKLKRVFGHIAADKAADGNMGVRDEEVSYEA
jgi:hypothetical protein